MNESVSVAHLSQRAATDLQLLGVTAQENEENVINETFLKIDQVEESWVYGAFFLAHEQIGIGGIHPGSQRGAKDLVYMRGPEFEGAMFEDEIE